MNRIPASSFAADSEESSPSAPSPSPLGDAPESGVRDTARGVVVYATAYCGYCVRAEHLLRSKNIPFRRVAVDDDWETRDWLVERTGQRTVPQIFIHGRSIGGFTELAALERSGRLAELLNERSE